MASVFGLTTELIVGSAPPEQAGAASGISETGAGLGGALGIAIMGSSGVAIYRSRLADQLSDQLAGTVLAVARQAFVAGMQLSSAIAAVIGVALAALALVVLRNQQPTTEEPEDATS